MKRRPLLLGASALAIAAAFGVRRWSRPPNVAANPDAVQALLAREFGGNIAFSEDGRRFADDVSAQTVLDLDEAQVILEFVRSTNVIRAMETGAPLVYLSLDSALSASCQNPLSAHWL
ncbi:MAG: hypothetical protein AAFY31_02070 [Pseudomonadota bacterium]